MKKLAIILSIILVIVLGLYFTAGYFLGNLPIASDILGTNKPRDLGAELSTDNAYEGLAALGHPTTTDELQAIIDNPASFTKVKATLTDDEVSSLISATDLPVKLVQVRFGEDDTVEVSGMLNISGMREALISTDASDETIDTVMDYASKVDWMIFYVSGGLSINNNQVDLDIDKLQLGRISLPENIKEKMDENMGQLEDFISDALTDQGYDIRELSISEGKVNLDLDRPLSSITPWLDYIQ